jgi:energy-coupling factor transport system ATP-binding protein
VTRLALDGVSFTYPGGIQALKDVDLVFEPGEAVAIIGQNGSGKTTLARHLNGLLRPTYGRVLHDGVDTAHMRTAAMAAVVGMAFQDPDRQIFARRIRDEVAFGPRILHRPPDVVAASVAAALRAVGLSDLADDNPYDIGYSRRKLLTLACVVATQTPIAVLDEPTTGQDARGITRVRGLIDDLLREGRTVIAISHDMRFVAETFPRIVVMRSGQVVLDDSPDAVFAAAAWPTLRSTFLEPPLPARLGASMGLGSTPTEAAFIDALIERQASPASGADVRTSGGGP